MKAGGWLCKVAADVSNFCSMTASLRSCKHHYSYKPLCSKLSLPFLLFCMCCRYKICEVHLKV